MRRSSPKLKYSYGNLDQAFDGFRRLLEMLDVVESKPFTAGGYVTCAALRCQPGDLDLFFRDEASFKLAYDKVKAAGLVQAETGRAVKLNGDNKAQGATVDLVHYQFGTPAQILDGFDIRACCLGFDYDGNFFELEEAMNDVVNKKLHVNCFSGTEATCAIHRIAKYANRGLTMDRASAAKMAMALARYTYPVEFEVSKPFEKAPGLDLANEFWDHNFNRADGRGGGGY